MKLRRGLLTDNSKIDQPEESWREATNLVFKGGRLVNEPGVSEFVNFTNKQPIGEVYLPDDSYLIFLINSIGGSELIKVKEGTAPINCSSDINFGFNKNYPIIGKARYTRELDIEILFTDRLNPPRIVTLDKNTFLIKETSLELTKLFPDISVPNFSLISVNNSGSLQRGSYQLTIAYEFIDGGYTNWIGMSNPIVFKENGGAFEIIVSDLDLKFKSFKIGIIKNDNGQIIPTESIQKYNIESTSKRLIVTNEGVPVLIEQISSKRLSYDTVGALAVVDGVPYMADLTRDTIIDYQQYANNILIEPVYSQDIKIESGKGSYSDPVIIFDKKGFADEEVYAFYINWYLKDGTSAGVFHIPGKNNNGMEEWVNLGEEYPLNKDYPTGNVKHWKFPKRLLTNYLFEEDFTGIGKQINTINGNEIQETTNSLEDTEYWIKFNSSSLDSGTLENDPDDSDITNNVWVTSVESSLRVYVNTSFFLSFTPVVDKTPRLWIVISTIHPPAVGDTTRFVKSYSIQSDQQFSISESVSINSLEVGDKVRVKILFQNVTDISLETHESSYSVIINESEFEGKVQLTRPIGIRVYNIQLPANIAEKVQGYEIMYAKRNASNSSIIDQCALFPANTNEGSLYWETEIARVHPIETLINKTRIEINKYRGQFMLRSKWELLKTIKIANSSNPIYNNMNLYEMSYRFNDTTGLLSEFDITEIEYCPPDNLVIDNEVGEEHYRFLQTFPLGIPMPSGDGRNFVPIVNLLQEKDNYYIGFENQILVSTGVVFKTPTFGLHFTNNIFNGDTFTTFHTLKLTGRNYDIGTHLIKNHPIYSKLFITSPPITSKINYYLLYEDESWEQKIGFFTIPESLYMIPGDDHENNFWRWLKLSKTTNYFNYNRAYFWNNELIQPIIQGEDITEYPFRIIKAVEDDPESNVSTWRQFLPNSYYELNKHRGRIMALHVYDTDKLIIRHEHGTFITKGKEVLATNLTEIIIGSGDILESPPKEPIHTESGVLGCSHRFSDLSTPIGFAFISNGSMYLLSKGMPEITSLGNRYLFEDILMDVGDNPYLQNKGDGNYVGGISMAYDKKFNRILLAINKQNESYLYSFTGDGGFWVGKHSYTDIKLFNKERRVFSLKGDRMYSHNHSTRKCIYHDNDVKESSVKVVLVGNPDETKLFNNIYWLTESVLNDISDLDDTFTKIRVRTSYQDTGIIDLVKFNNIRTSYNIRRSKQTWRFNLLKNNALSLENFTKKAKLLDNHIEITLWYDNVSQRDFSILDIGGVYSIVDNV